MRSKWQRAVIIMTFSAGMSAAPLYAASGPFDKCGSAPVEPDLKLDTVAHFNEAVDKFQTYQKDARKYDACVIKQARTAEEAISADARKQIAAIHDQGMAIHNRISKDFADMAASFNKASAKLKKSG